MLRIGIDVRAMRGLTLAGLLTMPAQAASAQSIEGTATYRERMALPRSAVFEARLEEVSRADAPAETIAITRITSPGNPPIAFTIAYEAEKIASNREYVVRARILLDGKLLFTTDTAAPVLTRGQSNKVSLTLRRAAAQTPSPPVGTTPPEGTNPSSTLAGTTWQLVKFEGSDDSTLTPDDRAKYTIAFAANGMVGARIDCNRGRGTWKSSGAGQLRFGPLALTRAMCSPGSLRDQIVKQWGNIRSYVIRDGHLFLSLMADGGIYEFEPAEKSK